MDKVNNAEINFSIYCQQTIQKYEASMNFVLAHSQEKERISPLKWWNCCDLKMYASLKALAKSNKNKNLNKQAVEIKHSLQLQHPIPPKLEETLKINELESYAM